MSYHLTILKTAGVNRVPITLAEFKTACANVDNISLENDDYVARITDGKQLIATLVWRDGEVWTKNSEDEVLIVMLELAKILNARVRGSEGETYRTINDSYRHPDDVIVSPIAGLDAVEWKRKKTLLNLVRWLLLIGVIVLIILNATK